MERQVNLGNSIYFPKSANSAVRGGGRRDAGEGCGDYSPPIHRSRVYFWRGERKAEAPGSSLFLAPYKLIIKALKDIRRGEIHYHGAPYSDIKMGLISFPSSLLFLNSSCKSPESKTGSQQSFAREMQDHLASGFQDCSHAPGPGSYGICPGGGDQINVA